MSPTNTGRFRDQAEERVSNMVSFLLPNPAHDKQAKTDLSAPRLVPQPRVESLNEGASRALTRVWVWLDLPDRVCGMRWTRTGFGFYSLD